MEHMPEHEHEHEHEELQLIMNINPENHVLMSKILNNVQLSAIRLLTIKYHE